MRAILTALAVLTAFPAGAQEFRPFPALCGLTLDAMAIRYGDRFELIPLAGPNAADSEVFLAVSIKASAIVMRLPNGEFCVMWQDVREAS